MDEAAAIGERAGPAVDLALQAGDLGTWWWDRATGEVVWNARMEAIFGFAPGEFDGTYASYVARLHPDEVDAVRAEVDAAVEQRRTYRLEHRVVRPDATVRWIRGVGQVLLDEAGEPTGTTGCVADITGLVVATAERTGMLEMLTFLVKAGEMLSRSLDLDETLEQIVGLAVPRIADAAALVVLDRGVPRLLAARHADPTREVLLHQLYERYPIRMDGPGMGEAIRTRQTQVMPEVPDELLRAVAQDDSHLSLIRDLGVGSGLAVPLAVGSRVVGALGLGLDRGQAVTDHIRHIAEALASRAAVAVENARLHGVATSVAEALQAGLAPPDLPAVEGMEVATRYVAAGEGVQVGGDFYDLVEVPEDGWLLTVGDVCGRGSAAASMNAQLRFAARALARAGMGTAALAEALNRNLLADAPEGIFSTAVLARLRPDPAARRITAEVVAAGHPPAVVVPADGPPRQLERSGPLLGVVPLAGYQPEAVALHPGDLLVVVTDGVLEARDAEGRLFGDARLLAVLDGCPRTAEGCAAAIEAAATDFAGGELEDDVAVVVIRCT